MSLPGYHPRFDAEMILPPTELDQGRENLLLEVLQGRLEPQEVRPAPTEKPKEIEWSTDLVAAVKLATDKGKPLVLQFTADWCAYCKSFENFILPNEKVQSFADEAVFVKAKPDDDAAAREAAESLNITMYPTMVILDAVGGELRERGRIVGYRPLADFVQEFTAGMRLPPPKQTLDLLPRMVEDEQEKRIA